MAPSPETQTDKLPLWNLAPGLRHPWVQSVPCFSSPAKTEHLLGFQRITSSLRHSSQVTFVNTHAIFLSSSQPQRGRCYQSYSADEKTRLKRCIWRETGRKKAEGWGNTGWELPNSHRDGQSSTGNTVSNTVLTVYGTRRVLELSGDPFVKYVIF